MTSTHDIQSDMVPPPNDLLVVVIIKRHADVLKSLRRR